MMGLPSHPKLIAFETSRYIRYRSKDYCLPDKLNNILTTSFSHYWYPSTGYTEMIYFNLNVIRCIQVAVSSVLIRHCSDSILIPMVMGHLSSISLKQSLNLNKFSPMSHTRFFFFLLLSIHVPKIAAVFYLRYQGRLSFKIRYSLFSP